MAFANAVGPYGPKYLDSGRLNGMILEPDGTVRIFTTPTESVLIDAYQLDVAGGGVFAGSVYAAELRIGAPSPGGSLKVVAATCGVKTGTLDIAGAITWTHGLVDATGAAVAPTSVQLTTGYLGGTGLREIQVGTTTTTQIQARGINNAGGNAAGESVVIHWTAYLDL